VFDGFLIELSFDFFDIRGKAPDILSI